jgi:hypothetical protein
MIVSIERAPFQQNHFGQFTLEPAMREGKPSYVARGRVDFFGEEAMARTGGAGGPDSTVRSFQFCLPVAG